MCTLRFFFQYSIALALNYPVEEEGCKNKSDPIKSTTASAFGE
jgi:hypothetical protein